jgi:hypothetical protein
MQVGEGTNGSVPDISINELVGFRIHANVPGKVDHAVALHGCREGHYRKRFGGSICLDDFFLARHCGELVCDLAKALRRWGYVAGR